MPQAQPASKPAEPGAGTNVFTYHRSTPAEPTGWLPFDPAENGGTEISPGLKAEYRIDFVQGATVAGQFRQNPGSCVVSWPFTEHAFLFVGKVEITDLDTGEKSVYGPGDGWIVRQGSRTKWDVIETMRKSFFQYVE